LLWKKLLECKQDTGFFFTCFDGLNGFHFPPAAANGACTLSVSLNQGNQIEKILAYCVIVFSCQFLKNKKVAHHFRLLFTRQSCEFILKYINDLGHTLGDF
jgi:hypothetical protein